MTTGGLDSSSNISAATAAAIDRARSSQAKNTSESLPPVLVDS